MTSLERIGWDPVLALAFGGIARPGDVPARVVAQHRAAYAIDGGAGARLAALAGRFRHLAHTADDLPAVGDWVAARDGVIGALVPRRNAVRRRDDRGVPDAQLLAANVDLVLVVAPLHRDIAPLALRIAQYVALARASGAEATVLLTKADLCPDVRAQAARAAHAAPGAAVHVTSSVTGEGVRELAALLASGRTGVLLGPSGAGKSTLVNALAGDALLATSAIDGLGDGRHATVRRELIALAAGGCVIDTPGLRQVDAWLGEESLDLAFGDIAALAPRCRFRDCAHGEEPGCAVRAAISAGALDPSRLRALRALEREVARTEATEEERRAMRRDAVAAHRRNARAARSNAGARDRRR
ncbi:MAG TPA: ribosome small subunit-dependent GTPase A [Candidatus Limnocylindria bacterium]|nr:ribosome small subunit-dependent GTPase A [Candidatus Limnocylindria bacterium]